MKIYKFILLSFFSGLLLSCDKQLSEPPANARVNGTAITDQKSAEVVLNGVYLRFANVSSIVGSPNTTQWTNNNVSGGLLSGALIYGFYQGADEINDNANSRHVPALWGYCYKLINEANGLIEGVNILADSKFSENKKNEIIAQARFLRAYGNFKLLMFFGEWFKEDSQYGVLLREELSTLSGIPKKRSTVKESYAAILEDLDFAIEHAPAENPNYYATKWCAMLLKMRVLMNKGIPTDYATVVTLADDIIQHSGYALEGNLKDLFLSKGLASKEVMLSVKPQANQEISFVILSRAYYPGASDSYMCSQFFRDLLVADPRGAWMVGPKNEESDANPGSYYFTKFIPFGAEPSQLTESIYAMRLSEVYLLKAEALIRGDIDKEKARQTIKLVMSNAGVTNFTSVDDATSTADLLLQNYLEVVRNLTGEDAIEWYTLLRLPIDMVKQLKPTIASNRQFYFPIPGTELDNNPLFGPQNPGYGL